MSITAFGPSVQPAEKRRLQQRSDARRAILAAAERLLLGEGYERFSMRRLAARCGYTAPTIYHYFGDKPGLIDALLEERFAELAADLDRMPSYLDPVGMLREVCLRFAHFGRRNPTFYRLVTTPRGEDRPPLPSAERARELCHEPIRHLESQGRLIGGPDVATVAQSFWALVHGAISLQNDRPEHAWSAQLFETALEALIRGFVHAPPGEAT